MRLWCKQAPSKWEVAMTDESKAQYAGAMDSDTRDGGNEEGTMKFWFVNFSHAGSRESTAGSASTLRA
jgi:hypothetical protein